MRLAANVVRPSLEMPFRDAKWACGNLKSIFCDSVTMSSIRLLLFPFAFLLKRRTRSRHSVAMRPLIFTLEGNGARKRIMGNVCLSRVNNMLLDG
jgi:hypothetical protein